MRIRDEFIATSAPKPGTKEAWAQYVRRRWPQNTVNHCSIEWDLTDGEARGLVFGQASQRTIDKVLDHPRGGFGLGLLILEIRTQIALGGWLQSERERLEHEAARAAADAHSFGEMASRLPAGLGLGGLRADRVPAGRTGQRGEVRSFRRPRPDRDAQ